MTTLSSQLAAHVHHTQLADLPQALVQHAKLTLLDTLAVAWAGLDAAGSEPSRQWALAQGGRADARVWGTQQRLPSPAAAFANGVAAAALDYDALHVAGTVHADIVALPALLAVAEQVGARGEDFLLSYILAQDLICRLGLSVTRYDGWFNTSVLGVFGAAAGAARLLGLGQEAIAQAIGLALPQAAGTQQPMLEQSQAKRLQSAFAARAAVTAAQLAAHGLTAPAQALEGEYGLFNKYTQNSSDALLQGLGRDWPGQNIAIKRYPNCGCSHAALDLALGLIERHGLAPGDVQRIDVSLPAFSNRLVGAPFAPGENPQVAAQFSVRYALAIALRDREFGLRHIEPAAALAPGVAALADKVHVTVDQHAQGRMHPVSVTFHVAGTQHSARADAEGSAAIDPQRLLAKVRSCFAYARTPGSVETGERLIEQVLQLEHLPDIRQLLR